jgi:hypothetical protein
MKKIVTFMLCCIIMSCGTSLSCKKYFSTLSTENIPNLNIDSIPFHTDCIDYHFPSYGTISTPVFDYDFKYDTLSRYRIVVLGRIVFDNSSNQPNQFKSIDSVGITRLIISRPNYPRESYTYHGKKWQSDKPLKECPLPQKILMKIREDFLIRMKYMRYILNEDDPERIKAVTTGYDYRLY